MDNSFKFIELKNFEIIKEIKNNIKSLDNSINSNIYILINLFIKFIYFINIIF